MRPENLPAESDPSWRQGTRRSGANPRIPPTSRGGSLKVRTLLVLSLAFGLAFPSTPGSAASSLCDADVCAVVTPSGVTLTNSVATRQWRPDVLVTTRVGDLRPGGMLSTTPQ